MPRSRAACRAACGSIRNIRSWPTRATIRAGLIRSSACRSTRWNAPSPTIRARCRACKAFISTRTATPPIFGQLAETIDHIEKRLSRALDGLAWVNLGGGYIADNARNVDRFHACAKRLRERFGITLFVEPGAAIARAAGTIVASVVDLFDSGGTSVAVLDTTVNHYPEVFEYQFRPDVAGHHPAHEHAYLLAGASCLAGDLFGTCRFDAPLKVGSRVAFVNAGAYTLVKAHRFNGINMPTIYRRDETGRLAVVQRFSYEDFLRQNGGLDHAYP